MYKKNKGSATIEATLCITIFLFFFFAIASILMIFFADCHIHQSLAEACEQTSVYCYYENCISESIGQQENEEILECMINTGTLIKEFHNYLGDDFFVNRVVKGGKNGILLTVSQDENNKKNFIGKATYFISFDIPLINSFSMKREVLIKQKGFVGYTYGEEETDTYVYVTPNQSVYHTSRGCTHLSLSIQSISSGQMGNYEMCGFCKKNPTTAGVIYVAKTSNVCHTDRACSGLKRTVYRVKKSSVGGLAPCSRCGK